VSGFDELRRLGVVFRPIDTWPGERTLSRQHSPFSASLSTTVNQLARELNQLRAKQVVVQIAIGERDIRLDGFPKANAHASHPGVVLAFESKYGPLKYATDVYWSWQDNLRAIALSMESLRRVDRYGVSKRGEQYQGWRALPAGSDDTHGIPDARAAREYLETVYGGDLRRALMETHPDRAATARSSARSCGSRGCSASDPRRRPQRPFARQGNLASDLP
jgi:hypothetical protein